MATFYPLNTPLINYFFYKAPFINSAYSVTSLEIDTAGTDYAVNDILILGGGLYSSPVVIQVTAVNLGQLVSFIINYNGKYITTPTEFTQLSTNGIGTGATFKNIVFTPNLNPPGPNVPLSGGFIYFYKDEQRDVKANTYSSVFDSGNPTVNPNPIKLGTSGDFPPIYLEDRLYYIVITDHTGDQSNPVETIEHYNPSEILNQPSAFNDNFIINPQFNYPIEFWKTTDEDGEITEASTVVAWCWEFLQDEKTESKNIITFEDVAGQGIEGSPLKQVVLECSAVDSTETTKDFRQKIGKVDFYAGKTVTFSSQMISLRLNPTTVNVFLELNYGTDGSPTTIVPINTYTAGISRKKYADSVDVPSIDGLTIGEGNFIALRIQGALQAICTVGITNVMLVPGVQESVVFNDESAGFSKGEILGYSTNISDAGLYENYMSYFYKDGLIFPFADVGTVVLCPTNLLQNFRRPCDEASLLVNGYGPNNIPNRRLYDAIGTEFGSGGDLEVSANKDVVTFTSIKGARQKSDYTAGTTSFTVTNTVIGLGLGINLTNNNDMTVSGEFFDKFAPMQTIPVFPNAPLIKPDSASGVITYWGTDQNIISNTNIKVTTLTPGSETTKATFSLLFSSTNPADYRTRGVSESGFLVTSSFLEFPTFDNNVRQPSGGASVNISVQFSLDGSFVPNPGVSGLFNISAIKTKYVPFKSTLNIKENIKIFVKTIANPFSWTIKVNSLPSAGQYFFYSDITTDRYGYFTIDGVGTDPAISGRTGTEIPLTSSMNTTQAASKIAEVLNTGSFTVPGPDQFNNLPDGSKFSYFINI